MEKLWRVSPWFARILLLLVTVLFVAIGTKFLFNTVAATKEVGLVLGSAEAATRVRVGFGGFPLGFAVVTLACLLSARRVLAGLWIAATVVTVVTAARVVGIVLDGPAAESVMLLRNEIVLMSLFALAITLETLRGKRTPKPAATSHGEAIRSV